MVYTLTLNPAIDYIAFLPTLSVGKINRSSSEKIFFGGKGINVSLILEQLSVKSTALGFTAGFTGEALEKGISSPMIKSDFVRLNRGFTRINIKLRDESETDINGSGPEISSSDLEKLYIKLDYLAKGDILVLSGSVPYCLPNNIYETIASQVSQKGVLLIIDAEKELLLNTLKYKPFLIKPNNDELSEIFRAKINDTETAITYAEKLKDLGAQNVLVSMGSKGAVLLDQKDNTYFEAAHKGNTVNTVGAGDSMLAGFIAGYLKTEDFAHALKLGAACGSATAFSEGLATKEQINRLMIK